MLTNMKPDVVHGAIFQALNKPRIVCGLIYVGK